MSIGGEGSLLLSATSRVISGKLLTARQNLLLPCMEPTMITLQHRSTAVEGANPFRLNLLKVPPDYHGSLHFLPRLFASLRTRFRPIPVTRFTKP